MRCFGLSAVFLLFVAVLPIPASAGDPFAVGFTPTTTPTFMGVRAVADLPVSQQHKNTGGSDGNGLCVYTSAWHACLWQSVTDLYGLRKYMESHQGGSYPKKFDEDVAAFCKSKGIEIPGYVQHTGGDEAFLRLALKTGRMVCITYCGVDGSESYGKQVVPHMVNLVYLSKDYGAILDNNFIGRLLWMTHDELLARWNGVRPDGKPYLVSDGRKQFPIGGGWAIAFLNSPPAPYGQPPSTVAVRDCQCEDCKCEPGKCPSQCPVAPGSTQTIQFRLRQPQGGCANGQCPLPAAPVPAAAGQWLESSVSYPGTWGYWVGDRCTAFLDKDGTVYACDARNVPTKTVIAAPAPLPALPPAKPTLFGVDSSNLTSAEGYSISGVAATRKEARAALSLIDDSGKWNLIAVGDTKFQTTLKGDLAKLSPALRTKIHLQIYAPDGWQVAQFELPVGLSLRQPAVDRVGETVGTLSLADYSAAGLGSLLTVQGGPEPALPKPIPTPAPLPAPAPAPKPAPVDPEPVPDRGPESDEDGTALVVWGALCLGGFVLYRRNA